ncbi:RluA family pseudouridine synthase [Tenuibacillus multivorans]|uniref:Pseudouridine synthase n=1 Tax=Tenuibacillus multivorans TaxID=237069 RepID=A0A1H0EIK2_9BACI|nr:RluA family pseudouridine synthase [Tenuibacillus multivorans]GEL77143.1 pseudouridine synthase [Tenuibacillus multivorans]SDN82183.1 23S rRNA pseudouridine1911/1915/1917 synthase [Tenuibacillus multivorans]
MKWSIKRTESGKLVRDYLLHDRAFSNRLLKETKQNGAIHVNDQPVTVRYRLNTGNTLQIRLPAEDNKIEPVEIPLWIVYEDDHLLVISKPRGLAVSPNMNDTVTLANGITYYYKKRNIPYTVHIVTRLDKYTSGLVVIAKHRYAHQLLAKNKIYREYRAVVKGNVKEKEGTIDLPITRDLPSIIKRKVDQQGKRAITHYQVLNEMRNNSLLKVWLETGRTHQIRVHFSHLGFPLIGDDLYGEDDSNLDGQALHCRSISLKHPIYNQMIHCVASYPEVIRKYV